MIGTRPGFVPPAFVAVLPTAQQAVPRRHVTEYRMLITVTFGLGWTDHDDPFQLSMKPVG
jgi:hypothetical protein